jgi:hypothetical protein
MSDPDSHTSGLVTHDLPTVLTGTWPDRLRNAFARNLEPFFVSLIGMLVLVVFYLFPHNRTAFLNFFYLPVLAAAYFLGKRKAVLGATLCILMMVLIAYYYPSSFTVEGDRVSALMLISFWGGFLILSSAAVGSLQEKLVRGFEETRQLLEELKRSRVMEEMKEKVEKTLYATMDPVVAKLATEGKLRFEKREVSIMFTDLTNFTAYSDRNRPDVVLDELNAFIGQIEPVIELFHGHIDKYMGAGGLRPARAAGRAGGLENAGEGPEAEPAVASAHRDCHGQHHRGYAGSAPTGVQRAGRSRQRCQAAGGNLPAGQGLH